MFKCTICFEYLTNSFGGRTAELLFKEDERLIVII